jgi:hypothetical protein
MRPEKQRRGKAVTSHGPEIRQQVRLGVPQSATAAELMIDRPRPAAVDLGLFLLGRGLLVADNSDAELGL